MSASDLEAQSQGHQILSCCLNSRPFPPAESKPTVSSELGGLVRNYATGNRCGGAGRKDGPSVLHLAIRVPEDWGREVEGKRTSFSYLN